ncbi:MAG: PRC-barrel domain-containing protein [Methanomassiliicoccaceae archaeon]|nr:PRC-barrel domain-containing protein [Methanomassiliicoccaceae archaeon]
MLENISNMMGLEIYAPTGVFVGVVDEVIVSIPEMSVKGLFVAEANPALVDEGVSISIPDEGVSISIPFRWVQSVGDVVLLARFPGGRIGAGSP